MPRKRVEKTCHFPYHVYSRVLSQKKYPPILLDEIWKIYCEELCVISWAYNAKIHLFVLMHNHYHLLIETPDANITEIMLYFQREVSKRIKQITMSQDFRFQARYKSKLILNAVQYENTYRYIAHNPVEAELCANPLHYRYSSLHGQFGEAALTFPIHERSPFSSLLPACMGKREEWIRCQV